MIVLLSLVVISDNMNCTHTASTEKTSGVNLLRSGLAMIVTLGHLSGNWSYEDDSSDDIWSEGGLGR